MPAEIKQTMDYRQFHKITGNRSIDELHVTKLVQNIEGNNLLADHPILVDSKKRILDGQHRLEAAKRLKVPIYYITAVITETMDIPLINSLKRSWKPSDYINQYIARGNKHYVKLADFITKSGINMEIIVPLFKIIGLRENRRLSKEDKHAIHAVSTDDMRSGRFIYPEDDSFAAAFVSELKFFCKKYEFAKRKSFAKALMTIMTQQDRYDSARMREHVTKFPDMLKYSSQSKGYIEQLNNLFNFHMSGKNRVVFVNHYATNW